MKFFLCFLLVAFVSANSSEHHGPAKRFDLTKCCKVEKSAATTYFIEGMVKLADQCKKEIGEQGSPQKESEQGKKHRKRCFHECLANKTHIINPDKSLNEDAYHSFVVTQMATEDYQKAVADAIVIKCIEKINAPNNSSEEQSQDGCSKIGSRAIRCASKELTKSCPDDKKDNNEKCVKFREMIDSGKCKRGKHGARPANVQEDGGEEEDDDDETITIPEDSTPE